MHFRGAMFSKFIQPSSLCRRNLSHLANQSESPKGVNYKMEHKTVGVMLFFYELCIQLDSLINMEGEITLTVAIYTITGNKKWESL